MLLAELFVDMIIGVGLVLTELSKTETKVRPPRL